MLAVTDAPMVGDFVKHAERFGTEGVMETAAECGHSFDALVRLQDAVDRIEAEHGREGKFIRHNRLGRRVQVRPKRTTAEERVKRLLGIEEEEEEES